MRRAAPSRAGRSSKSDRAFYYFTLLCLLATYVFCRALVGSRFGRVLRGGKENAVRMATIGFNVRRFQLVAYIIAGGLGGFSGFLLANLTEFVAPAYMSWQQSGELIVMVILGGVGTLDGALLGSAAYLIAEEWLSGITENWKVIFGPILVLVVLFARGGLIGLGSWLRRRFCPCLSAPHPIAVLRLEGLRKNFGSLAVTDDVTLDVMPGEMHAIIGPNGAGKTTLINQISGIIPPDGGRIVFAGSDVTALPPDARALRGLARSFQITSILPGFSVLENVALAVQARDGSSFRFFGSAAAETALNAAGHDGARTGRHRRTRACPRR